MNRIRINDGLLAERWTDLGALISADHQAPTDFGIEDGLTVQEASVEAFNSLWASWEQVSDGSGVVETPPPGWTELLLSVFGFSDFPAMEQIEGDIDTHGYEIYEHPAVGVPVLLTQFDASLSRRIGTGPNATQRLQNLLNSSDRLWGIATNGKQMRLLRSTTRTTLRAYVDLDVTDSLDFNENFEFEAIFRLLHRSRFPRSLSEGHLCPLEDYFQESQLDAGRVRDQLRIGVEKAVKTLADGFLANPDSEQLKERLKSEELSVSELYRQLLSTIYRLIFLTVAESRRLLADPKGNKGSYEVYSDHYSVTSLRQAAFDQSGDQHQDRWRGMVRVFKALRNAEESRILGITNLVGGLFDADQCRDLENANCTNKALLDAARYLTTFSERNTNITRFVNFEALGVEELGSVYESLLESAPDVDFKTMTFAFKGGGSRKETGSYYTPPELVDQLIKSALEPVLESRLSKAYDTVSQEKAILGMRVLDPAAGSGHFLLAAARRMGEELAKVRSNSPDPSFEERRRAIRDVIRRSIYAVDKNPLAVDLCRVALWIESQEPGLPLTFLDTHVVLGDSLVGVFDLNQLKAGIPDGAFKPVEGDDRAFATATRQQNARERKAGALQGRLDDKALEQLESELAVGLSELTVQDAVSLDDLRTKRTALKALRHDTRFQMLSKASDIWSGAFFQNLSSEGADLTTREVYRALSGQNVMLDPVPTADSHLHWPLEFPEAMLDGGFDVVVGNPPWERIKLQEKEFFEVENPAIANAGTAAARRRAIAKLEATDLALFNRFRAARRQADCTGKFLREGGRFPLGARGDINTYSVFAELFRNLIRPSGRAGFIVPSGLATDTTTKDLFADFVDSQALVSLFDFENRKGLFPGIDSRIKFSLVTLTANETTNDKSEFAFFLQTMDDLAVKDRRFELGPEDFALINPNTRTCPIFRSKWEAGLNRSVYNRFPVLVDSDWDVKLTTMFHITNDSSLFKEHSNSVDFVRESPGVSTTDSKPEFDRLYEGRMGHQFDHRFATYDKEDFRPVTEHDHTNPNYTSSPHFWAPIMENEQRLNRWQNKTRHGLLGFRRVARNTDERTLIACVLPRTPTSYGWILSLGPACTELLMLVAIYNSFAFDFLVRCKLTQPSVPQSTIEQIAIPKKSDISGDIQKEITDLALQLSFTASDLAAFAIECGGPNAPFRWDPDVRTLLRAKLDARIFSLYGIDRIDIERILDTFPIVKAKDLRAYGEFKTKRLILEAHDSLSDASRL